MRAGTRARERQAQGGDAAGRGPAHAPEVRLANPLERTAHRLVLEKEQGLTSNADLSDNDWLHFSSATTLQYRWR